MRVLHLFSNWKWTGPAEPALNVCGSLRARGVEVDFACAPGDDLAKNRVVANARACGFDPILDLRLDKHRHLLHNALDRRRLARLLEARPADILHAHLDNAHEIAAPVARRMGIPLVRTHYKGPGFPATRRYARLLRGTAFLIEPSEMSRGHNAQAFAYPAARQRVVPGAIDTARFDPARGLPDARARLGVPRDAFLVGIVARMQTHRHFEDLWAAARRLVEDVPGAHVVVVGRGTHQARVGHAPVQELGLAGRVHFPGYLEGDDYCAMLRAFDAGVFLVPGSDGTCRAVREIMAMGVPMVVADRGMLREIVAHGRDGLVCDGSPAALHAALLRLARNPAERAAFARAARAAAAARYSLEAQADAVLEVYRIVREARGRNA